MERDEGLNDLLKTTETKPTPVASKITTDKIKKFCLSRVGIAVIAFFVFFIALLMLRPNYVFQKDSDKLNLGLIFGISAIGGACVFFIPFFISAGD